MGKLINNVKEVKDIMFPVADYARMVGERKEDKKKCFSRRVGRDHYIFDDIVANLRSLTL